MSGRSWSQEHEDRVTKIIAAVETALQTERCGIVIIVASSSKEMSVIANMTHDDKFALLKDVLCKYEHGQMVTEKKEIAFK